MDLNKRDELHEAGEKSFKGLKSAYKNMFNKQMNPMTESAKSPAEKVGAQLKAKQKVSLKEEAPLDDKPVDDKPVDDALPKDDAAPVGLGSDVPPAPVAANAPDAVPGAEPVGDLNSQDQLATRSFVGTFLKTLPSDVDLSAAVDANGVFKSSVNDQHDGQFVVVVYPASKNLHQVADLVEPVLPGAAGDVAAIGSAIPNAAAGAPVVPGATAPAPVVPPLVGGAGDVPPVDGADAPAPEVPELEKKPEELTEMEKEEVACAEKEKERDPMMEGRKSWKAQLNKLLNESAAVTAKKKLLKEAEELKEAEGDELAKKEKALAAREEQLKNASAEDKADIQEAIKEIKSAIARIKTKGINDKESAKHAAGIKVGSED